METLTPLGTFDWAIIAAFFIITLGIGLWFSRRATGSMTEYFVAGRKMTWWLAGTSIVATSFAADTPLVISGWMRTIGLERNWFWWGGIMGMMLCTFFYARLWRRANILTDVEFNELRYGGAPAAGLRIFHATYRSLIQNTLVMCWVTLAMTKILEVTLNIPTFVFVEGQFLPLAIAKGVEISSVIDLVNIVQWPIVGSAILAPKIIGIIVCLVVATTYSAISGLWGVMATDFFQFCLAMTGTILLMVIVFVVSGGPTQLVIKSFEAVKSGIVINTAPFDRRHVNAEELLDSMQSNSKDAGDQEISPENAHPLLASSLFVRDEASQSVRWSANGMTETQVVDALTQAGVADLDAVLAAWKEMYTLSEGKFVDFDTVDRILDAGILVQDMGEEGNPRDYFRLTDASLSAEQLISQLNQAGIDNKSEIMAAWRHDRVVSPQKITSFIPPQWDLKGGSLTAIWSLIVFLGLQWWAGGEGGGFLAQRLFSCKNEKHSVLAMLWFNFANFVLRPWPWIVVGVASLFLIPDITAYGAHYDAEHAYVVMLMKYLPAGLKGLMVAALMAAYMSTISTHVNFGASYIVNDLYKRFIDKTDNERRSIIVSQITSVLLAVLAGVFAYYATDVGGLWLTMFELMSGAGIVILLRWYWWRINAWSEISAMASTLIMFWLLNHTKLFHHLFDLFGWPLYLLDEYAVRFTINFFCTTLLWVIVTFLTPPETDEQLIKFYKRIQPAGWWVDISLKAGHPNHLTVGIPEWVCWALGVTGLFAMLTCLGKLCFGQYMAALFYAVYSVVATVILFRLLGRMDWSGVEELQAAELEKTSK